MASTTPAGTVQRWREERPVGAPVRKLQARGSQRGKILFVLGCILAISGTFAGLLSWMGTVPQPRFVPLWITDYQARQIPFLPMGQKDLDHVRPFFPATYGDPLTRQERHLLLQELTQLQHLDPREDLVVYVRAFALRHEDGELYILPGDASPDNPATWIHFKKEVLENLRACPSRHKLLVLDIADSVRLDRLGVLYNDVAAAIPQALEAVPDPQRLVLCSCSPGQTSLISPELGRSVFSHYLEQGLKGQAEGFHDSRRIDGQIWVQELTSFLRARVDRWARLNRGQRQTPVLYGEGADFPLLALDGRTGDAPTPVKLAYPDWMKDAWTQRDQAWRSGGYRTDPRAFQQAQAILQATEEDWRGGQDPVRIQQNHVRVFERLQTQLHVSRNLVRPAALSLAQEEARGQLVDPKLYQGFKDWLDLARRQLALAKAEELVPLRAKLIQELQAKSKEAGDFALESVLFRLALLEGSDPATLQLFEQALFVPGRPGPRYAELQVLPLLTELGRGPEAAKSAELARMFLEVTRLAETAASRPAPFPWIRPILDEAAPARHEGEVVLVSHGFASTEDAGRLLQESSRRYESALAQGDKMQKARDVMDRALANLPWMLPFLEAVPALEKTWEQAAASARDLAEILRAGPPPFEPMDSADRSRLLLELNDKIAAIDQLVRRLEELLDNLDRPFTAESRQRLLRLVQTQASPALVATLEDLLSLPTPVLTAEDRAALWKARHELALGLLEATLQQDAEDDRIGVPTVQPEPWTAEAALALEQTRARVRARFALALLEMGGLTAEQVRPVKEAVGLADKNPTPEAWCKAGQLVRGMWSSQLMLLYQQTPTPQARNQLLWILPGLDSYRGIDDGGVSATTTVRLQEARQVWSWLGDDYRYRARDLQGLGLDSPALQQLRRFFTQAALAHPDLVQPPPEAYVTLRTASAPPRLTPEQPSGALMLELSRSLPAGAGDGVDLSVLTADPTWLQIVPQQMHVPPPLEASSIRAAPVAVPLTVTLPSAAQRPALAPPLGFLAQARLENRRAFHHVVPVVLQGLTQEVEIFVSANPKEPAPPLDELRLRPGRIKQPFFVYLRNLTNKAKKLNVEILAGDGLLPGGKAVVELGPKQTQKVNLGEGPPVKEGEPLPALAGLLEIRLRDGEQPAFASTKVRVAVASPREYVRVTDVRFEPASPKTQGKNKLSATLQALAAVPGPPIFAELVLPPLRIPGLQGVGGGTFQGEISNQDKLPPLTVFAEDIRLAPGSEEEGPVYLNVDGVERAFVFRATFARGVDAATPRGDGRPALRFAAPSYNAAAADFAVPVEVDNAPAGARLEVALGRFSKGDFSADLVRNFPTAKQQTVGILLQKGTLVLEASTRDWLAVFDTRRILGPRTLRARLLDEDGNLILDAMHDILIDGNAPSVVRFVDPPAKVKRGTALDLQVQGVDSESGIAKVLFFVGKPQKDEIPPNTTTIPAAPVDAKLATWSAKVPLPEDGKGPTPVTVQVVNKVGLVRFATAVIELTENEPGADGPGKIKGKVMEGPRAQPGLEVVLRDEKGKEKARAKTGGDGGFVFDNVKPGRYFLFCLKPDSLRRATMEVLVEPNKTTPATLSLSL